MKLKINPGRPTAVVARELGIVEQTLGNWVKAYRARHEAGDEALTEEERAELVRLRKENSELKMSRAFLKKLPFLRPGSIGYEREAFQLMLAEKSNFTIKRMARLLEVSRRASTPGGTGHRPNRQSGGSGSSRKWPGSTATRTRYPDRRRSSPNCATTGRSSPAKRSRKSCGDSA